MRKLINFILFYVGWVLCIFYHSFNIGLIVLCLALISALVSNYKPKEMGLILLLAGVGFLNDLLAVSFRIFEFSYTKTFLEWSNIWLFSLWVIFLTTFNSSLALFKRYNLAIISVAGAIGGTISYYAALQVGVIYTQDISRTVTYLIINWAILFPLLYRSYFKLLGKTK